MSVGKAIRLVGAALRPGANLGHDLYHRCATDSLIALGSVTDARGSSVLRAKFAGEGLEEFPNLVLEIAVVMFDREGWEVHPRRRFTVAQTMRMFADQVSSEFFGEPCPACRGHGVRGQKLDTVRHQMARCGGCKGLGYSLLPLREPKEGDEYVWTGQRHRRVVCSTCHGKKLVELSEQVKAGKLRACEICDATGVVHASSRARGRALQFDHQHIRRVWQVRFSGVLRELRRIERASLFECANMLFEHENTC